MNQTSLSPDSRNSKPFRSSLFKNLENPSSLNCLLDISKSPETSKSRTTIIKKEEEERFHTSSAEISGFLPNMAGVDLLKVHLQKENSLVLPFVKKFISILKNASYFKNVTQLLKVNFSLLNDSSIFIVEAPKKTTKKGSMSTIMKMKKWLMKKIDRLRNCALIRKIRKFFKTHETVLEPYQTIKIFWDLLHLLLIIYWFVYIPLFAVFQEIEKLEMVGSFSTTLFLIFDLILNFNTAYFKNGLIEKNRKKILKNYWKNKLKIDLITIFPMILDAMREMNEMNEMSPFDPYLKVFKFVFFLKISTIQEIGNRILEKFLLKEKMQNIIALLKTFFIAILVAHIFACFWYWAGDSSMEVYHVSWISVANIIDTSWDLKYLHSLYWASVTMTTVGYGDIVPQNKTETVVCMISVLLGCLVYAYTISSIGMILQEMSKQNVEFNHKISIINQFMIRKNINRDLQRRIREYLRYLWMVENTQNIEEEQKIIDFLSPSLKEELLIEAHGAILQNYPIFFANFAEISLRKVVSKVKEIRLFPDDKVFFENEDDDSSVYFVIKGKVELYSKPGNIEIPIKELGSGNHFGEVSFFTGRPRGFSVRSKDFTTLFSISRSDFIHVIETNPDDYEKFCMIKDQILLYEDYYPLKIRCFCCNQLGHLANKCPMIHFLPDHEKIIKKHNFYRDQVRNALFTRKSRKDNAFRSKSKLQTATEKFQMMEKSTEMQRNHSIDSDYDPLNEDIDQELSSSRNENPNDLTPAMKVNLIKEKPENSPDSPKEAHLLKSIQREDENMSAATIEEIKEVNTEISKLPPNNKEPKNLYMIRLANKERIDSDMINRVSSKEQSESKIVKRDTTLGDNNYPFEEHHTFFKKKTQDIDLRENSTFVSHPKLNTDILTVRNDNDIFESVKKFKNYFPEQNCQLILQKINEKNKGKNKESNKKIERKLKLAKYTFFIDEMQKKMPGELKQRSSKKKKSVFGGDTLILPVKEDFKNKKSIKFVFSEKKFANLVEMVMRSSTLKQKLKSKK